MRVYTLHFMKSTKRCQTKSTGVTTQMKALDEYILIVFVLLLKRVHFLAFVVVVVVVVVV